MRFTEFDFTMGWIFRFWSNFKLCKMPITYDSNGILRGMNAKDHLWIPILDNRGNQNQYWPIGLISNNLMCVTLIGKVKYPGFPKPHINEVKLKIPLASMQASQSGEQEET